MRLIIPIVILDAMLSNPNVAETSPAANEFIDATTYADEVLVTVTAVDTPTPTIATHGIYASQQAGNQGNDPTTDSIFEFWKQTDSTNRWRMFNEVLQQQTSNADTIEVEITPGEVANAVAFMNVDATQIEVIMTDPDDGEVYRETIILQSNVGIGNMWAWLFKGFTTDKNAVFFGLPAYRNATIKAIITKTGATVQCGAMVVGTEFDMGPTAYGASYGIKNYSQKEEDADGTVRIIPGAFKSAGSVNVQIVPSRFTEIFDVLTALKDVPIVFVGIEGQSATFQYAYYTSFNLVYTSNGIANCLLITEGLSS